MKEVMIMDKDMGVVEALKESLETVASRWIPEARVRLSLSHNCVFEHFVGWKLESVPTTIGPLCATCCAYFWKILCVFRQRPGPPAAKLPENAQKQLPKIACATRRTTRTNRCRITDSTPQNVQKRKYCVGGEVMPAPSYWARKQARVMALPTSKVYQKNKFKFKQYD